MAVISRLFDKMKRQPGTQKEQVAALEHVPKETLATIAIEGELPVLRAAAIARLDYGQALIDIAIACSEPTLQQQARQRVAELIDSDAVSFQQFSADAADIMVQLSVAGFCQQPQLQSQLLNSSTDKALLYKVALEGVSVKLRQLAAEKISDETQLKQLLKASKGKDKVVYKIVKEKCDGFRQQERRAAAAQAEIVTLCELIEAHSKRPFDALFTANANHLKKCWQRLESQSPVSICERTQQALAACQHTIDEDLREQSRRQARESAIANAPSLQQSIIADLGKLLASLYALDTNAANTRQQIQLALSEYRQRWSDAVQHKSAHAADNKTFVLLVDGISFQLQQLTEHGTLLQHMALLETSRHTAGVDNEHLTVEHNEDVEQANTTLSGQAHSDAIHRSLTARLQSTLLLADENMPLSVLDARILLASQEQQQADKQAAAKNLLRHITALIRKANTVIDAGQSRQAAGIRRAIEDKLPELVSTPAYLSSQLEQLDVALDKLQDWKNYAVEPKQQQLIEQMQALVSSQENPEALATKIRRLQDEWKGLSKGVRDQTLWESFHQLAQTAYQPCKLYFDAQAEIRHNNLEKRKQLVSQLKDYYAVQHWDAAESELIDWPAVETVIVTAIKEWRSYSPVERTANKPLQLDFDRSLDMIRNQLNKQYQQHRQDRQLLIEQAQRLMDQEDNRSAIDEVKRLQAQWKTIGVGFRKESRKDNQQLWKTFRASCDAIFEKRQQQTVEFKAQLNSNKNKAVALCAEVEALAALSGQALLDARTRVAECQREFKDLGHLPKAKANALNQAFVVATGQFEASIVQQRKAAQAQVWTDLLEAANKVRCYQLAVTEEDAKQRQVEALAYIESIKQWPKNGLAAIEMKMAKGIGDSVDGDNVDRSNVDRSSVDKDNAYRDNEQALKTLCIRAEIISGQPTPAEDQPLRLQCQIERLQKGLGQQTLQPDIELNAMVFEWVAIGPVPTAAYQTLVERFNRCRC